MEGDIKKNITRYRFEDSIQNLNVIGMGHFILFLCFIFPIGINFRAIICLLILLSFLVLKKIYNWQSNKINFLLIGIYLALLVGEILILGFPDILPFSANHDFEIAIMKEIFSVFPIIYVALRVVFLIPLMSLFFSGITIEHLPPKDDSQPVVDEQILDNLNY